jgi:hypothetical protein
VTLTRKSRAQRDFRDGQLSLFQHLFCSFDPAFRDLVCGRHSHRLLEAA